MAPLWQAWPIRRTADVYATQRCDLALPLQLERNRAQQQAMIAWRPLHMVPLQCHP